MQKWGAAHKAELGILRVQNGGLFLLLGTATPAVFDQTGPKDRTVALTTAVTLLSASEMSPQQHRSC